MDCKDFKELAPALALGALDESDRAACAAHLADARPHDGCLEVDTEARAVTARLASMLPDHPVSPRVWAAIEERLRAGARPPAARPGGSGRGHSVKTLRELAGWIVAAVILGLHLYNVPGDEPSRADAAPAAAPPSAHAHALALMLDPRTRRYAFRSQPPAMARGTLLLDPTLRSGVVLVDRWVPTPGHGLRLWAVRGAGGSPALVAPLGPDVGGIASAEIGAALFEPALPGTVLLSADPPAATKPSSVLMVATIGDSPQ